MSEAMNAWLAGKKKSKVRKETYFCFLVFRVFRGCGGSLCCWLGWLEDEEMHDDGFLADGKIGRFGHGSRHV